MERSASPAAPYSYDFGAGADSTGMERALNDAGSRGYRLHPSTFALGLVLLEKAPSVSAICRYKVVAATSPADLGSRLAAATSEGYSVVGMEGPEMVVLEKVEASAGP
jgi:hypothetical protein